MSKIEVNTVEPQCGTTLTLGACGDTVALGSGAAQTGFGRTGTVDWITTPKVTGDSPITAVTGEGYFLNTTAGTITINLPAGSAGSIVSLADYASTWNSNNVTVSANGSEKISGNTSDAILSTLGQSVTLVYVDGTQGWVTTADSTENIIAKEYMAATGGTPCAGTTCGNYKIHTFTGPGTLCVSAAGNPAGNDKIDFLVVGGGGGGGSGGNAMGGGAGAGGFRESKQPGAPWCASPLVATPECGTNGITAAVQGYPIVVGGGGAGGTGASPATAGIIGVNSTFSTIISTGGGGGGGYPGSAPGGPTSGGSGGGNGTDPGSPTIQPAGVGNTPPVSPPQGNSGDIASPSANDAAGGGGGALTAGTAGVNPGPAGPGGDGATTSISGSPTIYSGGGGGGAKFPGTGAGTGGPGGGGNGAYAAPGVGSAGTINSGGGAGGGSYPDSCMSGGLGGSGIVVIRYKFQ